MYRDRVFIGLPSPSPFDIKMSAAEWASLQGQKGRKLEGKVLDTATRIALVNITNLYASSSRNVESTETFKNTTKHLLDWIDATLLLRRKVWKQTDDDFTKWFSVANKISREKVSPTQLINDFLDKNRTDLERQFPLMFLDRILELSSFVSVAMLESELRHQWSSYQRNQWFIWAATIFSILRQAGFIVQDPNRKELLIGPPKILQALQSKLPLELQLRGLANENSKGSDFESFRKGAVIAWKLRKGNPTASLERLLKQLVQGQSNLSYKKGSPEIKILLRLHRLAWPEKWKASRRTEVT